MTDPHPSSCLPEAKLSLYVRGLLNKQSDDKVVAHLASCERCEATVRRLEESGDPVMQQLTAKDTPDPYLEEPELQRLLQDSTGNGAPPSPAEGGVKSRPETEPAARKEGPRKRTKKQRAKKAAGGATAAVDATETPSSGGSKTGRTVAIAAGILAVAAAVAGVMMQSQTATDAPVADVSDDGSGTEGPGTSKPKKDQPASEEPVTTDIPAGFRKGQIPADEVIETIRISIATGTAGESLREPINVHLGLGFPLRLHPVGTVSRNPSFSAYPSRSSLAENAVEIAPGETAWFEFRAASPTKSPGTGGNETVNARDTRRTYITASTVLATVEDRDALHTSRALLANVKAGDIRTIGFASRGETPWILDGYSVEINGQLFASNSGLNADVSAKAESTRVAIEESLPRLTELEASVSELQVYVDSKMGSDEDAAELAKQKRELQKLSRPALQMAGVLAGTHPWYVEDESEFPAVPANDPDAVREVTVSVISSAGERAGTRNTLYLQTGPRKYAINSDAQPLAAGQTKQDFRLRPVLPLSRNAFKDLRIGVIASDLPFDEVPDRAHLERVVVSDGDAVLFDSGQQTVNRKNLPLFSLIPIAHRDSLGQIVENPATPTEIYSWTPGMEVPKPEVVTDSTDLEDAPAVAESEPEVDLPDSTNAVPVVSGLPGLPITGGFGVPLQQAATGTRPAVLGSASRRRPPITSSIVRRRPSLLTSLLQGLLRARSRSLAAATGRLASALPRPFRPAVTPTPAAGRLAISGVRMRTAQGVVVDRRPVGVTWTTTGSTSNVARFRVDLNIVAPNQAVLFPGVTVATNRATTPGTSSTTPPLVQLTPNLTLATATYAARPSQLDALYVQPRVTAIGRSGRTVGVSALGPILPIVPAGTTTLRPSLATRRSFEINGDAFSGPWLPFQSTNALAASSTAWSLIAPQSSHNGLLFDAFGSFTPPRPVANSVGVRPINGTDFVAIRFDGALQNLTQDMRLIAHIGFIDSPSGRPVQSTANVLTRLTISQNGRPPAGGQPVPNDGQAELLRLDTTTPIPISKLSRAGAPRPMQVIDIPVRLNLAGPAYSAFLAGTPHSVTFMANGAGIPNLRGGRFAPAVNVSATFVVNTPAGSPLSTEGVGIFGVRLVPISRPGPPLTSLAPSASGIAAASPVTRPTGGRSTPTTTGAPRTPIVAIPTSLPATPPATTPPATAPPATAPPATAPPATAPPATAPPATTPPAATPPAATPPAATPPAATPPAATPPAATPPAATPPATTPPLSQEVVAFMKAHNDARSAVGVTPLRWSPTLAQHAQVWADVLASGGGGLQHRSRSRPGTTPIPRGSTPHGENLFLSWNSTGASDSALSAATSWLGEKNDFLRRTPNKMVGHFTQAVWAATTEVGFGKAVVNGKTYVVASYSPAGNFVGQRPYPSAPHAFPSMDRSGNAVW